MLVNVLKCEDRLVKLHSCIQFLKALYSKIRIQNEHQLGNQMDSVITHNKRTVLQALGKGSWQNPVLIQVTGQSPEDATLFWVVKNPLRK